MKKIRHLCLFGGMFHHKILNTRFSLHNSMKWVFCGRNRGIFLQKGQTKWPELADGRISRMAVKERNK